MNVRTDLALEAREMCMEEAKKEAHIDGVEADIQKDENVTVTKIKITNQNGAKALGKPRGNYITVEAPNLKYSVDEYEKASEKIAEALGEMIDVTDGRPVLAVGLGNSEITPDALGPAVTAKLIVTRHMKAHLGNCFGTDFSNVCAIAPGVLGNTGIETAAVIRGVADEVKPGVIIAIDALAARSTERISTTIQISDTGIRPGAGVGNRREILNEETLGVKVLSIGVPTVVDAATIAADCIEKALKDELCKSERESLASRLFSENASGLVVTPKDIDYVIERASKTVANGINLAVHKNLTLEDIESFSG